MKFEFDAAKSASNKEKHGIDFVRAQDLWKSKLVLVPAKEVGEKRHLLMGVIAMRHWTAIITYRETRIRIISVRRSTPLEILIYEEPER